MSKIGFVILHYLSLDDTLECINSILCKIDTSDYCIVVIDNASPDGSGISLSNHFKKDEKVHIIQNQKNLGFSRGNNIGIDYARKRCGCDMVVVLNNDTCIIQDNFCKVIEAEFQDSHFAVLGPQVLDPKGNISSSPLDLEPDFSLETLKGIKNIWLKNWLKSLFYLENIHRGSNRQQNVKIDDKKNQIRTLRMEHVMLHGCCLVFSPEYFKHYAGFEELTFMYGEESILMMNCDRYNLLMVYNPKLQIYHKEAVATKKEYTSHSKKVRHNKRMYDAAKAIYLKARKEESV